MELKFRAKGGSCRLPVGNRGSVREIGLWSHGSCLHWNLTPAAVSEHLSPPWLMQYTPFAARNLHFCRSLGTLLQSEVEFSNVSHIAAFFGILRFDRRFIGFCAGEATDITQTSLFSISFYGRQQYPNVDHTCRKPASRLPPHLVRRCGPCRIYRTPPPPRGAPPPTRNPNPA